jgi:hypothetical protein
LLDGLIDLAVRLGKELSPDEATSLLKARLAGGTGKIKEEVLDGFMRRPRPEWVPAVIEALLDDTHAPRHGDTGWGRIHHQAATALCQMAQKVDGMSQEERGRKDFSFYDDGGAATQKRREEVHARWLDWWKRNREKAEEKLKTGK